jgi:hypothetical protein
VGADDDPPDEVSLGAGAGVGPLKVPDVEPLCEPEASVLESVDVGVGDDVGVVVGPAVSVGDGLATAAGAAVAFGHGRSAVGVEVGLGDFVVAVATSCDTAGSEWKPSNTAAAAAGASKMKFTPVVDEPTSATDATAPTTRATPAPITPPSSAGRRERVTSPARVER